MGTRSAEHKHSNPSRLGPRLRVVHPADEPPIRRTQQGWRRAVATIAVATAMLSCSVLATSNVWKGDGWPENHEGLTWKFRVLVHASHQAHGDPFPIWSSEDLYGLGTPLPLYYHKLFYILAGAIYNQCGSMKATMVASVCLWLFIGMVGMLRALRVAGVSFVPAACLACTFPLWNYTNYDWLVRGAFAEFSAAAIVPWLLTWCLRTIRTGRLSLSIAVTMTLLFYAHSVLAMYAGLLVLLCAVVAMMKHRRARIVAACGKGVIAAVLFLAAVAPQILLMRSISQNFDPSAICAEGFHPCDNFKAIEKYFFDYRFLPGGREMWNSVQINSGLWLILAASAALWWLWKLPGYREQTHQIPSTRTTPVLTFLLASTGLVCFLQLPISGFVYRSIPGFDYLQFPWRLLCFLYPLLALLTGLFLKAVRSRQAATGDVLLALLMAMFILETPAFKPVRWDWYSSDMLESQPVSRQDAGCPGTAGEYWPARLWAGHEGTPREQAIPTILAEIRDRSLSVELQSADRDAQCHLDDISEWESSHITIRTRSLENATLVLPWSYSGLERVYVIDDAQPRRVQTYARDDDPRMRVDLELGEHEVVVFLPSIPNLVSDYFGWIR